MNIDKILKKYTEFYKGKSYSDIATLIRESELSVRDKYSHRTLRRFVSEYIKNNQVVIPEGEWDTNTVAEFNKPIQSRPDTIPVNEDVVKAWVSKKKASKLQPYLDGNPNDVLIISDTQFPFERKGYLEHCRAVQEEYNLGSIIHIGDVKDSHASSFHTSDVDGYSAGLELDKTIERTREWHRIFPNVKVCLGNHDLIILRKAMSAGVSSRWIKGLAEVLETPTWEYATEYVINGTMYTHTLGSNALNAAVLRGVNLVVGHEHSKAEIRYAASLDKLFWAMNVGAGVDDRKYAFAYAKTAPKKSVITCGVVKNGIPHLIPMQL